MARTIYCKFGTPTPLQFLIVLVSRFCNIFGTAQACKTLELPGVTVQQEFGGTGLDATASVIVHEELAAADPGFCLAYLAHSLLFCNNLAVNGNDEQRSRFLPPAIHGDLIGGMCMSEPEAGTDVLGMRTTAKQEPDGSFLLNGSKMWITNGAISDTEQGGKGCYFLVFVQPFEKYGTNRESVALQTSF
eukprot:SAG31_NODE_529_length_14420_cov_20.000140_10_plen_189_part_00